MWRQFRQSNGGESTDGGEHDDLVARLASVPRPSAMPSEMEERVRARLNMSLATPVHHPLSAVSSGLLGGLPFTTQAIVAALLLSVAGWLVVRDVQAYSSPYYPFASAYTAPSESMECAPLISKSLRHHRLKSGTVKTDQTARPLAPAAPPAPRAGQ